jgi:hypothetical protein
MMTMMQFRHPSSPVPIYHFPFVVNNFPSPIVLQIKSKRKKEMKKPNMQQRPNRTNRKTTESKKRQQTLKEQRKKPHNQPPPRPHLITLHSSP